MTADLGARRMRGCLSPPRSTWRDVKSGGTFRTLEGGVTGEAVVPSPPDSIVQHQTGPSWDGAFDLK